MNFFDKACQQGPFTDATFGICDDEDGGVAYVSTTTPPEGGATVLKYEAITLRGCHRTIEFDASLSSGV